MIPRPAGDTHAPPMYLIDEPDLQHSFHIPPNTFMTGELSVPEFTLRSLFPDITINVTSIMDPHLTFDRIFTGGGIQ